MRTVAQNIYSFIELSESAKEKAIQNQRNYEQENYSPDELLKEFSEELSNNGFLKSKIYYSGFCSQGDGLSFDSEIDLKFFVVKHKDRLPLLFKRVDRLDDYIEAAIYKNSYANHYSHRKTRYTEVTTQVNTDPRVDKLLNREVITLDELVDFDRLAFCDKFYRELEIDYDRAMDDDSIIETLKANDYEFLRDGEIYIG